MFISTLYNMNNFLNAKRCCFTIFIIDILSPKQLIEVPSTFFSSIAEQV